MFGHITQKQWEAHPSFRQDLKQLLDNPVFAVALQIVLDKGLQPKVLPAVDPSQWAALMGQRKEGYLESLDNLWALTESAPAQPATLTPWKTPPKEDPKPQT